MHLRINGILRGDRVDLDHSVEELPDGSPVSLVLSPREVSLAEKRALVDELCGSWKEDATLEDIFDRIISERHESNGRTVNLDDPS